MTNLDSIFKSRDITWPTKGRLVKAMVFLVVGLYNFLLGTAFAASQKFWFVVFSFHLFLDIDFFDFFSDLLVI